MEREKKKGKRKKQGRRKRMVLATLKEIAKLVLVLRDRADRWNLPEVQKLRAVCAFIAAIEQLLVDAPPTYSREVTASVERTLKDVSDALSAIGGADVPPKTVAKILQKFFGVRDAASMLNDLSQGMLFPLQVATICFVRSEAQLGSQITIEAVNSAKYELMCSITQSENRVISTLQVCLTLLYLCSCLLIFLF